MIVYTYVRLSIHPSTYVSEYVVHAYTVMYVCIQIHVLTAYLHYIYIYIYIYIYTCIYLSIYLSIYPSLSLYIYIYIYAFLNLSLLRRVCSNYFYNPLLQPASPGPRRPRPAGCRLICREAMIITITITIMTINILTVLLIMMMITISTTLLISMLRIVGRPSAPFPGALVLHSGGETKARSPAPSTRARDSAKTALTIVKITWNKQNNKTHIYIYIVLYIHTYNKQQELQNQLYEDGMFDFRRLARKPKDRLSRIYVCIYIYIYIYHVLLIRLVFNSSCPESSSRLWGSHFLHAYTSW